MTMVVNGTQNWNIPGVADDNGGKRNIELEHVCESSKDYSEKKENKDLN